MKKIGKKAQHSFLNTALVILLIIAVVVAAGLFISKTISKGTNKIEEQEKCLGVLLEITQPDLYNNAEFKIKRMDSKKIQESIDFLVLADGKPTTDYTLGNEMTSEDFKTPYTSSIIKFKEPVQKSFEIAIKINNTLCQSNAIQVGY